MPKPAADPSWNSSVYFEPGTKYIWDLALDKSGNLYVATGDHGEIYRVTPKGEHSVFFKSDETHIRVLAFDAQENLIAGSDGSGLIYRISPAGEGFVLYSAPKKEITALAVDRAGNIYAAAVGEKRSGRRERIRLDGRSSQPGRQPSPALPPAAPGITITPAPSAPQTAGPFPFPGGGASGGSDVYRIAPDGSPTRVWTSREDIVYALAFDSQGRLLAGTGNRGHIFAITGLDDFSDLLKAPASQVTAFAKAPGGGLYAATSNLGKVFVLGPGRKPKAPTRAMCLTPRFSRAGDAPNFAARAAWISMPAAATSTIPTATGVRGKRSTWARTMRLEFRLRATRSGEPCSRRNHGARRGQYSAQLSAQERRSGDRRCDGAGRTEISTAAQDGGHQLRVGFVDAIFGNTFRNPTAQFA